MLPRNPTRRSFPKHGMKLGVVFWHDQNYAILPILIKMHKTWSYGFLRFANFILAIAKRFDKPFLLKKTYLETKTVVWCGQNNDYFSSHQSNGILQAIIYIL